MQWWALGTFGSFHARVWSELPYTRLAAVCDRDAARAAALGAQYGVPWYTDHRALLAQCPAKQCQWRRRIICTDRWRWMLPVRESMFW